MSRRVESTTKDLCFLVDSPPRHNRKLFSFQWVSKNAQHLNFRMHSLPLHAPRSNATVEKSQGAQLPPVSFVRLAPFRHPGHANWNNESSWRRNFVLRPHPKRNPGRCVKLDYLLSNTTAVPGIWTLKRNDNRTFSPGPGKLKFYIVARRAARLWLCTL